MKKYKVIAVSYLNTKPLLYGLLEDNMEDSIEIELAIPSVCAKKLKNGEADIGLIPVAAINDLPKSYIISDYCIGSNGAVKTVAIFSDCPIEEITHVYLDYHSRTSVALAQLLFKKHWKKSPIYLQAKEGFIAKIGGTKAAVVIGDRTIGLEQKHQYIYDLGAAWKEMTGLSFVYAAWVSTKPLSASFIDRFNKALAFGITKIPKLIYLLPSPDPSFDLKTYFSKYISYDLNDEKRKALKLFLTEIEAKSLSSS